MPALSSDVSQRLLDDEEEEFVAVDLDYCGRAQERNEDEEDGEGMATSPVDPGQLEEQRRHQQLQQELEGEGEENGGIDSPPPPTDEREMGDTIRAVSARQSRADRRSGECLLPNYYFSLCSSIIIIFLFQSFVVAVVRLSAR